jgi:hypothetical protein
MRSLLGRFHRPFARGVDEQLLLLNNLGDGSTLSLDFTTGVLDPRLTFTRSTNATFINSQGLVQYADANMVVNSTMLVITGYTQTLTGTGAVTINGDNTVRFNGLGGRATWFQTINVSQGLPISYSVEVTSFTNNNLRTTDLFAVTPAHITGAQYRYTDTNGVTSTIGAFDSLPVAGSDGRGLYTVYGTTAGASFTVLMGSDCNGVGRLGDVTMARPQVRYDQIVPRRSYLPNSSTSLGNFNTPRFDYDPSTLQPRGLLIEGSASNYGTHSESFATSGSGTLWTYSELDKNATLAQGPSGANDAAQFNERTTTTIHRISQFVSAGAGAVTISVWAKAIDPATPRRLYMNAIGFMGCGALFDLDPAVQTGASGNAVNVAGSAANRAGTWVKYPNGWYRCSIVGTYNTGQTLYLQANRASSTVATDDTYSGSTANGLMLYGFQTELGSGASSYIPTGASTGSRAFDSCVMTGTNFSSWFAGATEGVLYGETERPRKIEVTAADHGIASSRYQSGGWLGIAATATNQYPASVIWPTGGFQFAGGIGTMIPVINKQAVRWFNANDITNFANGTQASTNTAGTGTVTPTMLSIGANSTSGTAATSEYFNGCIRRVKFWPIALPDSQIIALTT